MLDESSPIYDFYPREFLTDLNGKKNDWEAVVLIPFIEEKRLLEAVATKTARLTEEVAEQKFYFYFFHFLGDAQMLSSLL